MSKEGKVYYSKEELAHWEERNMPTPRQYKIIMAVQNEEAESIDDLPFFPTEEEILYFNETKEWYERVEKETGKRPVFTFIPE